VTNTSVLSGPKHKPSPNSPPLFLKKLCKFNNKCGKTIVVGEHSKGSEKKKDNKIKIINFLLKQTTITK
jgi:hypothetical protein